MRYILCIFHFSGGTDWDLTSSIHFQLRDSATVKKKISIISREIDRILQNKKNLRNLNLNSGINTSCYKSRYLIGYSTKIINNFPLTYLVERGFNTDTILSTKKKQFANSWMRQLKITVSKNRAGHSQNIMASSSSS